MFFYGSEKSLVDVMIKYSLCHRRTNGIAESQKVAVHMSMAIAPFWLSTDEITLIASFAGLGKMRAVGEQRELLTNLQEKFARRLAIHLNNIFIQQVHKSSAENQKGVISIAMMFQ